MQQKPLVRPPEPSKSRTARLVHPRRWLLERRGAPEGGSTFAFRTRLLATVILTFALIGVTGYVLLERNLGQRQITDYAASQQAEAKAFEHQGARATTRADGIADINRLLRGIE